MLDLNSTLQLINNIAGLINVQTISNEARRMLDECPDSFIVGEFVFDIDSQVGDMDALKQSEYFARRWWELEYLDFRSEVELCLIDVHDLVDKIPKTERLLIDIRSFEQY